MESDAKELLSEINQFMKDLASVALPVPVAKKADGIKRKLLALSSWFNSSTERSSVSYKGEPSDDPDEDIYEATESLETASAPPLPSRPSRKDNEPISTWGLDDGLDTPTGEPQILDVSLDALKNPTHSGNLDKRRPDDGVLTMFMRYQKRFCVIHNKIFYYFEKGSSKKQSGAFYLKDYEARTAERLFKDPAKRSCSFELVGPGLRTYQFLAPNPSEMDKWMEAISQVNNHSSSGGSICREDFTAGKDKRVLPKPPPDAELEPYDDANICEQVKKVEDIEEEYDDVEVPKFIPELPKVAKPLPEVPRQQRVVEVAADDYANMYYGLWKCSAERPHELSFEAGDKLHVIERKYEEEGWLTAVLDGKVGLVPKDFLTPMYTAA